MILGKESIDKMNQLTRQLKIDVEKEAKSGIAEIEWIYLCLLFLDLLIIVSFVSVNYQRV